jgi:hypothetical protein
VQVGIRPAETHGDRPLEERLMTTTKKLFLAGGLAVLVDAIEPDVPDPDS